MISLLANPHRFIKFARIAAPVLGACALFFILLGMWFGLYNSPEDYQQGHSVRIMYVHVPAALSAMMAYASMAVVSLIAYIWRHPLADELAKSMAFPGAAFTALALVTGSLWGKTSWGTFWQWDGRMTSVLILLFLYIGYMSIWNIIEDKKLAARIAGLVAMIGAVNLPIIKYSVDWWSGLHQKSTGAISMDMQIPLYLLIVGYSCFFGWIVINRVWYSISQAKKNRSNKPKPAKVTLEKM